jgi:RNA polymerase sigma-70 factor (ECF subfamily)
MNSFTEQELLNGALNYDLPALSAIYDRYSPGIYRYAMRLLSDDCLAEDCVADTFSRFLKVLRSGQGPQDHLQAYLYRIAHNWIIDSYRRQPLLPLDLDDSLNIGGNFQLETEAETHSEKYQVRMALRSLTPDQRQVITLRFIEGWENEEVAVALEKPVGAIRALQFRALNTLRRLLLREEKEGVYESKK